MASADNYTNHLNDSEPRWFAVYTKPKREKLVEKYLRNADISCYLPLQTFTRYYTRKIRKVDLPLINGYIFVKITKKQYVPVLETPDVVHFVKFSKNLIAIPEQDILILRRIVGENIEIEARPLSHIAKGDEVEIIGGRLTGIKGKLVAVENEKNFLVEFNSIGYSLCISVPGHLLQKVGGRQPAVGS